MLKQYLKMHSIYNTPNISRIILKLETVGLYCKRFSLKDYQSIIVIDFYAIDIRHGKKETANKI